MNKELRLPFPYEEIRAVLIRSRRIGNTEYLLQAAVRNPKVRIVCRSNDAADLMRRRYRRIIRELPWYRRLWRWIRRMPEPEFTGVYDSAYGRGQSWGHMDRHDYSTVFDNSALC